MEKQKILLAHGSGGKLSHNLINDIFLPYFKNTFLEQMNDAAVLPALNERLVFTTDSYVVDPIFFPGGDIGKIAICGTINDIAMLGARPLYMSVGFIIEEGLLFSDLEKILLSMRKVADEAGVQIVTGDTKVVPHGAADKIFINTSGIGALRNGINIGGNQARSGDIILINGPVGDHGVTVLAKREGLEMDAPLKTDSAPLNDLVERMLTAVPEIHVLRDPTRGGVATTLNEIALQSNVAINIYENRLPVSPAVRAVCEILGLDPLFIANEGKLLAVCPAENSQRLLDAMLSHKYGKESCVIGEIVDAPAGKVILETAIGGKRILDMLTGEQLPRIC